MTHRYEATIKWQATGDVAKGQYSRARDWVFDGGVTVPASASPTIVPLPYSDASAVDPEEAYVASISSCHMLFFVDLSRRAGFLADTYEDRSIGTMEQNAEGLMWVSRVELNPKVTWQSDAPTPDQWAQLHHDAHHQCFIANSVRTEVVTNL